jgi:hypothetical protein
MGEKQISTYEVQEIGGKEVNPLANLENQLREIQADYDIVLKQYGIRASQDRDTLTEREMLDSYKLMYKKTRLQLIQELEKTNNKNLVSEIIGFPERLTPSNGYTYQEEFLSEFAKGDSQ